MRITRSLPAIIAALLITAAPLPSPAQVSVGVGFTVGIPPPAIPAYTIPPAPYPNYMWTPGYWGWGPAGYYWVPGTWIAPPSVGLYWTPGYWGYNNGYYGFNAGYWGPTVGFYGGINYGYGYFGSGFVGGVWNGGNFAYNTAVMPVNRTVIHNTYNKTVIINNHSRTSFNGGHGGIQARPTSDQIADRRAGRPETSQQRNLERSAAQDRGLLASNNHGRPPVTALQKPVSDPKQLPHYAPVTAADRQAAQTQMKHGTMGASTTTKASANKGATKAQPMTAAHHANTGTMTTTHHNAPVSAPAHKQPPTTTMHTQNTTHSQGSTHAQPATHQRPPSGAGTMHAAPGNAMGKPGAGHPPSGGQGQGKPPSGSGGGGKNKPPH